MITIEEMAKILKESPLKKIYGLNNDQIYKIAEETFEFYGKDCKEKTIKGD